MRFLSLSLVALSLASGVSAACTGNVVQDGVNDAPDPVTGGTPSANALPLWWTRTVSSGNFKNKVTGCGATGGLPCLDAFCNRQSDSTFFPPGGVTATVEARTGLYKALISSPTVNAYDRFFDVNPITNVALTGETYDVVDANGLCLTANVNDLFLTNYNLNFHMFDQAGLGAGSDILSWTASTSSGVRYRQSGTDTEMQEAYCSEDPVIGWNSVVGNTQVGFTMSATKDSAQEWLGVGSSPTGTEQGCSLGFHVYCLQAEPAPAVPGGTGDPQFTGLQGQSFQVHGMPEEYFNLITSPDMQLNSRFAYLASGNCNYNNTECWTHPGTYVDQLGFMFPGLTVKAVAGTHDEGMMVFVNEKRITTGPDVQHRLHFGLHHDSNTTSTSHDVTISHSQSDRLIVSSPLFTVSATNSDMFFNFGLSFHSPSLLAAGSVKHHIKTAQDNNKYPQFPLHGLLGQTWRNARYSHGRFFAGTVDDYMLLDSKLFSNKFIFNQYKH